MAFTLSDPSEKMVLSCHPAWTNKLFTWILTVILLFLSIVALVKTGVTLAFGLVFLLFLACAEKAIVAYFGSTYIITNKRVIVIRGLFSVRQDEVWIADMRGLSLHVSLWQKIIGTGDVMLGTAATAGAEIVIRGISNPQQVIDLINKKRKGATSTAPNQQQTIPSSGQVVYDPVTHQYVRK